MKNKKGFTLIELLAVLVVLAILALISVPITIRIINQARENSYKRSIESYGKAIESYIGKYLLNNDIDYKNIKLEDIEDEVKYNGSKVTCRRLKFKDNGDIVLTGCTVNDIDYYKYEDRHATKQNDTYDVGKQITVNGIDFYVIKDNGDYVTALKKDALTVEEANTYGGEYVNRYMHWMWSTGVAYNQNGYGGVAFYSSATCGFPNPYADWTTSGCAAEHANEYDYSDIKHVVDNWHQTVFSEGVLKEVDGYYARLIKKEEINGDLGCTNGQYCNYSWVINPNYDYWIMTPPPSNSSFRPAEVYILQGSSGTNDVFVFCGDKVVRPVINVYKSAIDGE